MGKHIGSVVCLGVTALFILACKGGEREPGPSESEFGDVLFWDVVGVDAETSDCPDTNDIDDLLDASPFIDGGVIAYRLSESGSLATLLDCTEYDDDACSEAGLVLEVDGNEMKKLIDVEQLDAMGDCALLVTEAMIFYDEGESALVEVVVHFQMEGDEADCEALDQAYAAQHPDGVGIDSCMVTHSADLVFARHDRI